MTELMRRLATLSLSARVAVGIAFLLIFGGLIVSIAAFAYGREAARSAYDRLLLGAATDIASAISVRDGQPEIELPVSAFELLALAPDDRIGYRIIGPDGSTLTGYDELVLPTGRNALRDGFFDGSFFGAPARFAVVSRRFAERTLNGTIQVVVGQTIEARNAMAYDITRKALYVLAASGLAMVLLSAVVVRSVLKPLETMAGGLSARDPHDLTPMDTAVPRETAVMVNALNGFMARLDRQMNSMRHLISDTAHQLRTPVAALRAQADLFTDEADMARKEKIVERLQTRTASLGRLLDQMLAQALVIHRGDSARREAVDLRDIALDVFEEGDHQVLNPEFDIQLEIGDAPVIVMADEPSLKEALKNLLNNAVKYGASPVRIGASREGNRAGIWVEDAGTGPADAVLAELGGRFNKGTLSRQASSGLGLAIAHSVAVSFGGELALEKTGDNTFRASLMFAAAPEWTS
ncbi:sensor histidine kinase N-terminal domain-containing protein [Roseibium sediminicola]|uniref:histidine kinase n=1 Tax=Roseibium sediminicola TaxID=2933272 RepID=A0ABT0GU74_9HYPH|nr:sensor histidine kinase N-terminal domain-containing protein [Roseibium sp. CAU 1639]MCK7612976.1 sensor histidine kinase N-terminal domain-containing protein [Roseibium sp. CAU 1639]